MKILVKILKIAQLLSIVVIYTACSNAVPKVRAIFTSKVTSSSKNAVTIAGGTNSNGTVKINYSVNMVNSVPPVSNGSNRVRVADPQVLHHVH